jgi:hypothetical protein
LVLVWSYSLSQRDFASEKIKRKDMGALIAEEVRCAAAIKAFVREIDAAMEKAIRLELMCVCCYYGCGALNGFVALVSTLLCVLLKCFNFVMCVAQVLQLCYVCCSSATKIRFVTVCSLGEFEPSWANPVFW